MREHRACGSGACDAPHRARARFDRGPTIGTVQAWLSLPPCSRPMCTGCQTAYARLPAYGRCSSIEPRGSRTGWATYPVTVLPARRCMLLTGWLSARLVAFAAAADAIAAGAWLMLARDVALALAVYGALPGNAKSETTRSLQALRRAVVIRMRLSGAAMACIASMAEAAGAAAVSAGPRAVATRCAMRGSG